MLGVILDCWNPLYVHWLPGCYYHLMTMIVMVTYLLVAVYLVSISSPIDSGEEYCMLEVLGMSTWQRLGARGLSVASVSSVVEARFAAGLKPRMSDAKKGLSLF